MIADAPEISNPGHISDGVTTQAARVQGFGVQERSSCRGMVAAGAILTCLTMDMLDILGAIIALTALVRLIFV
jgi:hypothetical protein